jgi:hypothetical protein
MHAPPDKPSKRIENENRGQAAHKAVKVPLRLRIALDWPGHLENSRPFIWFAFNPLILFACADVSIVHPGDIANDARRRYTDGIGTFRNKQDFDRTFLFSLQNIIMQMRLTGRGPAVRTAGVAGVSWQRPCNFTEESTMRFSWIANIRQNFLLKRQD